MSESPALSGPELIADFVTRLPAKPGVYRMFDDAGEVIYVGKARSLKSRVGNYARGQGHNNRIALMISLTHNMEFVVTASEAEALLLEANLIKKLKPKFNVILRDDKSFPYILIAKDHEFAQLAKHRGARARKGNYYGPFASALAVNTAINTLQKAFLLRSCNDSVFANRTRPCLLHQIKRCSAPCVGLIEKPAYDALVLEAEGFLAGKSIEVKAELGREMEQASAEMRFEDAARMRDRIKALSFVTQTQGINPQGIDEADVFGLSQEGGQYCVQVFFIRSGQNWGTKAYFPKADKATESPELLEHFLTQFYDGKQLPAQILLSHEVAERELLEEAFTQQAGRKVEILVPQRGEKKALVEHAALNAREAGGRKMAETSSQEKLLEGVARVFDLPAPPRRIEVYDNSHIQGAHAVGGMIVAGPEGLMKSQYRKFNMDAEALKGDDFGMMREMLTRRFTRLIKEHGDEQDNEQSENWPQLVLIDGGQGQLSAARGVLDDLGLHDLAVAGVAKGPDRDAGREHFYMPGRESFMLEARDPVLYYIQRLRDEAHRFAIGSHRARRSRAIGVNPLDEIEGIGPTRKKALLLAFGSAKAVSRASVTDLGAVEGVSQGLAQAIFNHFHPGVEMVEQVMKSRIRGSKVWSLPNVLTYGRLAAVPVLAGLLLYGGIAAHWVALAIYIAAAVTDFFDGYLARLWQQQSALGRMLDPIADKVLVSVVLLVMAVDGTLGGWNVWAAIIITAREVLVSGLREFLMELRVRVPVTWIAKWKTTVQLVAIGFLILGPAGDRFFGGITYMGFALLWVAAALTLYTGYDYFRAGLKHVVEKA